MTVDNVDDMPIIVRTYGEVTDMPIPQSDTIYIVSILICQALPNRRDIVHPGTLTKDDAGNIITNQLIANPSYPLF